MTSAQRRRLGWTLFASLIFAGAAGTFVLLWQPSHAAMPISPVGDVVMRSRPHLTWSSGSRTVAPVASTATSAPAPAQPARPEMPAASGDVLKLKFDVLGGWKFVEGKTPIPDEVKKLDGRRVETTGFMLPINETTQIKRFIVIQSLWGCCFGQTPAVNHIIVVTMAPGKTCEFSPDLVNVTGRFMVGETREDGFLISIYQIKADNVVVK